MSQLSFDYACVESIIHMWVPRNIVITNNNYTAVTICMKPNIGDF